MLSSISISIILTGLWLAHSRTIRDFDNSLLFIIIYDATQTHTHSLGVYSIKCQIELAAYVIILYDSDENA